MIFDGGRNRHRFPVGTREVGAASSLGQQDLDVWHRWVEYSSCMSTLRFIHRLRWWKPNSWSTRLLLTPSSHSRKGSITRGRTLSIYLIGGSQTVQHHHHSRTCCVQWWLFTEQLTQLLTDWESILHLQWNLQWRSEEVSLRLHWIIHAVTV